VRFDEGGLTGRVSPGVTFSRGDFRNWYFRGNRKHQVYSRVQCLATEANIVLDQLPDLALRFCLTHPTVSTVIPGMRSSDHVYNNASASDHGAIPDLLLARLRQHRWKRNFYSASYFEKLERFYFAPFSEKMEMIRKRL